MSSEIPRPRRTLVLGAGPPTVVKSQILDPPAGGSKPHAKPGPTEIFFHGAAFSKAARILSDYHNEKDDPHVLAPTLVNVAFAVEMYLKCLLMMRGKSYPRGRDGHNLKKLFDGLAKKDRTAIEGKYNVVVSKNPRLQLMRKTIPTTNLGLSTLLIDSAEVFCEWRYVFEIGVKKGVLGLGDFAAALRQHIREIDPKLSWHIMRPLNAVPGVSAIPDMSS
jgi:hypothetical protein